MCCDAPSIDTATPAIASLQAQKLANELGYAQLDEAKRQYDKTSAVAAPVAQAQLDILKQTKDAGDQYLADQTKFRPIEQALVDEANASGSVARQEQKAGTAIADTRRGSTAATNMAIRQGLRYGLSPRTVAGGIDTTGLASAEAAAANAAREKEQELGFAKRLDVAGLGRGLVGASQGAYSVANQSGNSAVANTALPGQQQLQGAQLGINTILTGNQQRLSTLNGIMNAQANQGGGSGLAGLGSLLGGSAAAYMAFTSSKEVKTKKRPISEGIAMMGLRKIPVEQWQYKEGEGDGGEHVGPYAEDVNAEFGDEAAPNGEMIDPITMNGITIAAVKDLDKRLQRIEKGKKGLVRRGDTIDGEYSRVEDEEAPAGDPVLPHIGLVRRAA